MIVAMLQTNYNCQENRNRKRQDHDAPTKRGLLQLLTPVQAVSELEQAKVIFRNMVDQMAGGTKLS